MFTSGGGIRKTGTAIKNAAAGASFPSSVADGAAPRGGEWARRGNKHIHTESEHHG